MGYKEVHASCLLSMGTLMILVTLYVEKDGIEKTFFRLGPCIDNDQCAMFFGIPINSMSRYIGLLIIIILKEFIISFAYTSYRPWYQNQIMDHKSAVINRKKSIVILMVINYKIFSYLNSIVEIILVMTMEAQYLFCQFLVETSVYVFNTISAMKSKVYSKERSFETIISEGGL